MTEEASAPLSRELPELEKKEILAAMRNAGGVKTDAARILGVSRKA